MRILLTTVLAVLLAACTTSAPCGYKDRNGTCTGVGTAAESEEQAIQASAEINASLVR